MSDARDDSDHPHHGDKVAGGRWKRNILIFDALLIALLGWLLLDMITEQQAAEDQPAATAPADE